MSDNWRTDEPEVGQVCRVLVDNDRRPVLVSCGYGIAGFKVWLNNGFELPLIQGTGDPFLWQPITNPEERRLRQKVEELEGKLLILRNSIINAPIVLNTSGMIHRWSDDLVKSIDQKGE